MGVIIIMNENNGNKSKYEIDAKQIFDIIIKYWWITVISVALLIGVALGYSVITDSVTYTSSATLLINGGSEMTSYQQILAGQYQSKDYPYILTSRDTLGNAAKILNESGELPDKDYTAAKLSKMISYKSEEDSRIFKISVTSDDPTEAMVVAKCVSTEFCERAEQLTKAMHDYELKPSEETFVSIDYKQSGIGSNSCGPQLAEEYRLKEKKFGFAFTVKPTR